MKEILLCVCMYVCVSVFLCLPCLCLLYNFSLWFYLCPCVRVIIYKQIRFYRLLSLSLSLSFSVSLAVTIPLLYFSFSAFSPSLPLLLFLSLLLSHSLTHSLSPLSPSHSITLYIYFPLFLTHLNSLLSHPSFLFSFDTAHNFLTLNASYCTYWYDVCVYLHICPSVPVCSNVL